MPSAGTFEHLLHNPQCFLILESDAQLPPTKWSKVDLKVFKYAKNFMYHRIHCFFKFYIATGMFNRFKIVTMYF